MQKRGSAELLMFAVVAVIAIGGLFFQPQFSASDATGAAPYGRTVERGVPDECQATNNIMIKITRDIQAELLAVEKIHAKIKLLIDIKAKLLKITNTNMKTAVLTCTDWYRLVPGLDEVMTCDEIERIYDEERNEMVAEGQTCGGGDRCVDEFPWDACASGADGGDKSLSCSCEPVKTSTGTVDRCVPRDDPKLWVFQKNVWTMKKILLRIKIELEAEYERLRLLYVKINEHFEAFIKIDGQLKDCIRRQCITHCPQDDLVSTPRSEPRDVISTPQQPRDRVTTGQPQEKLSCEDVCSGKGMTTSPPSSSSILAELQQHECVSGANIRIGSTTAGDCKCYGKAKIDIIKKKPMCDTPCGPLACGESTECPCPDGRENCVMHAQCSWGGWKDLGNYRFAPQLGKASGHLN